MSRTRSALLLFTATIAAAAAAAPAAQAETNTTRFSGGSCSGEVRLIRTNGGAWGNAFALCSGKTPRLIHLTANGSSFLGPRNGNWTGSQYFLNTGTYNHSWIFWPRSITLCTLVTATNGTWITGGCTKMAMGSSA